MLRSDKRPAIIAPQIDGMMTGTRVAGGADEKKARAKRA
jgi:hypothetical protein